jgi:hypothetical protein
MWSTFVAVQLPSSCILEAFGLLQYFDPNLSHYRLVRIIEPAELNSSALFRELAIIVYYITGGYYRDCRFTYVENLLLIVLLLDRMSIFSSSKAR